MHSLRLTGGSLVVSCVLALALIACAGEDPAAPPAAFDRPPAGAAGSGSGGATAPDGSGGSGDPKERAFGVVDAKAAPCEALAVDGLELADPDGGRPAVSRLISGLGGWLAQSSYDSGVLRLSADGSKVRHDRVNAGALDRLTLLGGKALVISANDAGVIWASYDDITGLGEPTQVFEGPVFEVEVNASGSRALAVWAEYNVVRAQLFNPAGPFGEPFELFSGVILDSFQAAVSELDKNFVVAFSTRRHSDGHFETRLASVTNDGEVGPVRLLYQTMHRHTVVDVAPTASGSTLLIDDDGAALLAPLDTEGRPRGDATRFVDAATAYALEGDGEQLLLGARLMDGRDALRLLDEDAEPAPSWQCLHEASSDAEHAVALGHDGKGFAVLFRDEAGKNSFARLDAAP